MIQDIAKIIGVIALFAFSIIGFALLFSLPTWLLWNWCLVPAITVLKPIGWIQTIGILFVSGALFKSSSKCTCTHPK